ncbi:homologous recombination OB-fold protein [Pristis pectinata]|uniref:homologous recombination OB-fold protein n=1 Tax=Pristis pectinata TaxID=685728 RepID=UPI00223D750A|nr:homologous recombination OB-fold protein [Pristis pectinata]
MGVSGHKPGTDEELAMMSSGVNLSWQNPNWVNACSFQKLFSVGEEFDDDDDDLLSAALDAESTAISPSGTTPSVGLRPITSALRTPAHSCYKPVKLACSIAGQKDSQSEPDSVSNNITSDETLAKKTLTASFDVSLKSPSWPNKQHLTPNFNFVSNAWQNITIKPITDAGKEGDDLLWAGCEELTEAGNTQNSTLGKTRTSTSNEKSLSTPGSASSQIYSRGDRALPPAKFPRLPGGHAEADNVKSQISQKLVMNNFEDASKTYKDLNQPSYRFNKCPISLSNAKTDAVAMGGTKKLSGQIIDNHSCTAELSNTVSGSKLCNPSPSSTVSTTKELLTPVPQNSLGKHTTDNTNGPGKIDSPSLQSAQHQKMSSTALRNCPNSTPLRPRTPLNNTSTPTFSDGGLRRPIMSTSESRTLMCTIESPSVTAGAQCSPAANSSCVGTPVTNRLIQLVSAANRTPEILKVNRPRAKRRFPGPAGILPQQHHGKNLDEVLISAPQTPAHGAVPKLRPQEVLSSQQSIEDDFGRGPWATMKEELRLDEGDTSCFLRNYSIVMVLRKAALKQLPKGKVPNMAVLVKSLTRTNTDASAVFKDPSGEMQGTIHRQLLVEQPNDLKVGTVLLLKQVGVFSPSLRNHYLNITPSNVIKIYPQGSTECIRSQVAQSSQNHIGLQSTVDLLESRCSYSLTTDKISCTATTSWDFQTPSGTRNEALEISECKSTALHGQCDEEWEADDLDCLMAELPEEYFTAL